MFSISYNAKALGQKWAAKNLKLVRKTGEMAQSLGFQLWGPDFRSQNPCKCQAQPHAPDILAMGRWETETDRPLEVWEPASLPYVVGFQAHERPYLKQ